MAEGPQKQFDFNRSSQLRIIELCKLILLPTRARHRAKSLLKAIDSHIRSGRSCCLMESTLALEMGCECIRTVRRAIRDCETAALITVVRRSGRSSEFSLNWSLLLDLSQERMDDDLCEKIRGHLAAVVDSRKPKAESIVPRTLQQPTPDSCVSDPGQLGAQPRTVSAPVTGYQNRKETGYPESGVCRQDRNLETPKLEPSVFAKLTVEDLRDDHAMQQWFEAACRRKKNPLLKACDADRLFAFAAAVHARGGDSPIALFKDTIVKGLRGRPSQDAEEEARRRLRIFDNPLACVRAASEDASWTDSTSFASEAILELI